MTEPKDISMLPTAVAKPRYVLLFANIFTQRDWGRFGCDVIQGLGYEVVIVECRNLQGRDPSSVQTDNFFSHECSWTPKNLEQMVMFLNGLSSKDLICLNFAVEDQPEVFLTLGKKGLRYVCVTMNLVPTVKLADYRYVLNAREYLGFQAEWLLGFLHRLKKRIELIWKYKTEYWNMAAPLLWVRSSTDVPLFTISVPHMHKAKIMNVESSELYWERMADEEVEGVPSGPYAVFLDESVHNHPDYETIGLKPPVEAGKYFSGLNQFFDKISQELNMPVVIAAHPKSNYTEEQKQEWFMGRSVVYGKTPHLVKSSKLVILHISTALSFAVLNRKPVFFLTSDEIEESFIRRQLVCITSWIGQRRINVDHLECEFKAPLGTPTVNEKKYKKYERLFLRPPNSKMGNIWEQVILQFESLNGPCHPKER